MVGDHGRFSSASVGEGARSGLSAVAPSTAPEWARAEAEESDVTFELDALPVPPPRPSPAEVLENLPWSPTKTEARAEAKALAAEKRAEAKAQGYEGEACGECGNFTLVRNGTCLKCNTCGSTTGCS